MYQKIDKSKYTPMMRQYLTIKEDYPDTLVFFRLGDFYEMFFNDAIVASRELEIVLTGRDAGTEERVPMCGVPFHSVDSYIDRLTEKGYKVAIVEQLEEPSNKKIVLRDVVRVITPGTVVDEKALGEKDVVYLASLEKDSFGYSLSYVDLSTGLTYATSFPLNEELVINEVIKLQIKEIVVSSSFDLLKFTILKNNYGVLFSVCDETKIDPYLSVLINKLPALEFSSAQRLLAYVVKTQKRVLIHLQKFNHYDSSDYLKMDLNCVRNLELIESIRSKNKKNSLFYVLDQCVTAMGSRYLKKSILYPLFDQEKIINRQIVIKSLINSYLIANNLIEALASVYDLERIIGRISYGNLSPKDLLMLKKSLSVLPIIKENLFTLDNDVCRHYANQISDFSELTFLLEQSIREDAPYYIRDGGIIKSGYNKEFDELKNISSKNKEFLVNLEIRERERTGIKNLKVGYNKVFGYFIEVTKSNIPLIKKEFGYIRKQTLSNAERYITEELKEREVLILRADEKALELEQSLFNEIRDICKGYTSELQKTALIISELDMLLALSIVAKKNNFVCPTFGDSVDVIDGWHPVLAHFSKEPVIPNDLKMTDDDQIIVITGPNMSGKSTYMRQNALLVIMAQMGSFVPAVSCTLPIFDQIFTRIGSSDDITSGESTFMVEMLEVNFALKNATENSLILLDEVGRGTATFDGMALAQAILEYIHNHTKAKTLFSTHYHELTILENDLKGLKNVHVDARSENDTIIFFHKVLPGPSDESYGINVAKLAELPDQIIHRANDILIKIEQQNGYEKKVLSPSTYQEPKIIKEVPENVKVVIDALNELDVDNLKPLDALMFLAKIKEKL